MKHETRNREFGNKAPTAASTGGGSRRDRSGSNLSSTDGRRDRSGSNLSNGESAAAAAALAAASAAAVATPPVAAGIAALSLSIPAAPEAADVRSVGEEQGILTSIACCICMC
jgi:hypothetical protein